MYDFNTSLNDNRDEVSKGLEVINEEKEDVEGEEEEEKWIKEMRKSRRKRE